MTLVELLVAVGILLLLAVSVIPILSPTADQKGREAAATVATMIERVKNRAVSTKNETAKGAGLWLEPMITAGSVVVAPPLAVVKLNGGILPAATLDMFTCERQDSYTGDDPETARVFCHPVNSGTTIFVPGFRIDENIVIFNDQSCTFIREFCGQSSEITIPGNDSTGKFLFRLLSSAEQEAIPAAYLPQPYRDPSVWSGAPKIVVGWIRAKVGASMPSTGLYVFDPAQPVPPTSSPSAKTFAITRPTTRSATPPLSVPEGYAIDVAWSCCGTTLLHNSADAARPGNGGMQLVDTLLTNQPIQVMFDSDGIPKDLIYRSFVRGFGLGDGSVVDQVAPVTADVLLLVGRADRVGRPYVAAPTEANPGANWQYPDSRWVKISQTTGKVVIADPFLGVNNVYASQSYARADIAALRN